MPDRHPEYYIFIMVDVALSIGSNSGDRRWYIDRMEEMLKGILFPPHIMSLLMETEPVGVDDQPWYFNRIIGGLFDGSAFGLFDACNTIERALGRKEKGTGRERTADIDILLFGKESIRTTELSIPHPALFSRRFCLEGLYQIMPDATIGDADATVSEHYAAMTPEVRKQGLRFTFSKGGYSDD